MGIVFDGRRWAEKDTKRLSNAVIKFADIHNRKPRLISVYDPKHEPSRIYTAIKEKKANELGILFEKIPSSKNQIPIIDFIEEWNQDETVDGIMIQTPLENDQLFIGQISPNKDVDGLKENSPYLQATVRATLEILNSNIEIRNKLQALNPRIVVVGSGGRVGSGLMEYFHKQDVENLAGLDSGNFDPEKLKVADIIISAVGAGGLITADMVKEGVVAIDVGYPKGDFAPDVASKAGFFTPVPGGVGPVTVVSLFANLLKV